MRKTLAGLSVAAVVGIASCSDEGAVQQVETPSTPAVVVTAEPEEQTETSAPEPTMVGEATTAEATPEQPESADVDDPAPTTPRDADLADHDFATTAADAIAIASEQVSGIVHEIELEWEDDHGAWIWEVQIQDGDRDHDIKINADSGEVVDADSDDTDDQEQAIDLDEPMTFDQARGLALAEREGRIESWKLDHDDGRPTYEFDIVVGSDSDEVYVDTESGNVTLD